MNRLKRALSNLKARRQNLSDDGTAYHGTNASSMPEDTRWWRSYPREATCHVPGQFDFTARVRDLIMTYPQAFDDTTGTFLFPWLDTVQDSWIVEIERAFHNAVFQEKGLFIEDERRAREAAEDERRLHAAVTSWDKQYRAARDHLLGEKGATTAWDASPSVTAATTLDVGTPVPASLKATGVDHKPAPEEDGQGSADPIVLAHSPRHDTAPRAYTPAGSENKGAAQETELRSA